jgi:hypothetical protein
MVISAIGRMAAKAAIKKISNASAKKARAANKENLKKTDFKAIEAMKTAEGTERISKKKGNKIFSGVLPAAAGPGKLNSFSEKQLGMLSKQDFGPLLNQKSKKKSTRCFRSF